MQRPDLSGLGLRILKNQTEGSEHPVDRFTDDVDAGKIIKIPVDAIAANPDQPRKYFDEQALHDLTESVREHGILQPIIVCRRDDEGFYLIAGERRWRAAKKAGLEKIPALVRGAADSAEIALIENLQRENLNPIEEAESLQRLKERRNLSDAELAHIVGKSRPSIIASLSLNRLPAVIRDECQTSDKFTKSQLLEVLRQPTTETQLAFWQVLRDGKLTVRQARAEVEKARGTKPLPKSFEHTYRPEDQAFTVKVKFRKTHVTADEIRQALEDALRELI